MNIRERNPQFAEDFDRQLAEAKAHALRTEQVAEQSAQSTRKFIAWIRESRPVEGWVSHEITAANYDDAVEKASQRFAGTQNAYTLEVEAAE